MFRLKESIHVNAPLDRCFLLSTSVPLVQKILGMKPVEGNTTGLVVAGDRIVWRGWKFGVPAMHESLISSYQRPTFFQDTMGQGQFSYFQHDHHFEFVGGQTVMWDVVRFSMPLGAVGRAFGKYVLVPHVLKLLCKRLELLKRVAESKDWEHYISAQDEAVNAPELGLHAG